MKFKISVKLFLFLLVLIVLPAIVTKAKITKNNTVTLALLEFRTKDESKESLFTTKTIYEIILKNLTSSKKLRILDRSKLAEILNEKTLIQSGLIEKDVKQAAGLIAADYILSGEVYFQKTEALLSVRLTNALTGELKSIEFASGNRYNQLFDISDKISAKILKVLTGEKFQPPKKRKIQNNRYPFTFETNIVRDKGKDLFLFVKIKVSGKEKITKRKPINLAVVIDRSQSMESNGKMDYTKKAVHYIIDQMKKTDLISLIAFNTDVEVLLPPSAGNRRSFAHHRINKMLTHFNTNLSAGMIEGYKQIGLNQRRFTLNHILIITDGLANLGITENREIWKIVKREFKKGITTTTIGLGKDYDEILLGGIADSGGGNYYYVKKPSEIPSVALAELRDLLPFVVEQGYFEFKTGKGLTIKTINGKQINKIFLKKLFAPLRAEQTRRYYFRISGSKFSLRKKQLGTIKFYYGKDKQKKLTKLTKKLMNPGKFKGSEKEQALIYHVRISELMTEVEKTLKTLDLNSYKKIVNKLVTESNSIYDFALKSRNPELLQEYFSLKHCTNELLSLAEWGKLHPHDSMRQYSSDELQKARKEIHFQRYKMNSHR